MSGEPNPLFSDPALMRVTPQAASQPADGSPPRYGSAVAPEGTAFHSCTRECDGMPDLLACLPRRDEVTGPNRARLRRRVRRYISCVLAIGEQKKLFFTYQPLPRLRHLPTRATLIKRTSEAV